MIEFETKDQCQEGIKAIQEAIKDLSIFSSDLARDCKLDLRQVLSEHYYTIEFGLLTGLDRLTQELKNITKKEIE